MKSTSLSIDLAILPQKERFPFWREIGSRIYRPLPTTKTETGLLLVRSYINQLRGMTLARMESSTQNYERTRKMIRNDGYDHFIIALIERGEVVHATEDQELIAKAGDLLLLDLRETAISKWTTHSQLFATIPRQLLEHGATKLRSRHLPQHQPQAKVLASHLRSLWQVVEDGAEVQDASLCHGLAALVSSYIKPRELAACLGELAEMQDRSLIHSIKAWIDRNLHQSDLDTERIARQFHLSRSSLYRLFNPWGGVSRYIRERRMEIALQLLRNHGDSQALPISRISNLLGFPSSSAFTHAFKRQWGVSPRTVLHNSRLMNNCLNTENSQGNTDCALAQRRLTILCEQYYQGLPKQGQSRAETW